MKKENKKQDNTVLKEMSAIDQLRSIRDQISHDIQDMNFEELKKYITARLALHPSSYWTKEK